MARSTQAKWNHSIGHWKTEVTYKYFECLAKEGRRHLWIIKKWERTSGLSHPIISPYDTWWHKQYVGSLGSTGMSKTSDGCIGRRASLRSGLEDRNDMLNGVENRTLRSLVFVKYMLMLELIRMRYQGHSYLFFIFFFLGDSSSEPFLPLPLDPRFSLSPLESPSVKKIFIHRCIYVCLNAFFNKKHLIKLKIIHPTYFSPLFHRCFHSRSLLASPSAHSQNVPGLHRVCGYVCPPKVKGFCADKKIDRWLWAWFL